MADEPVTVAIFGLGYVGSVMAGCLSMAGHRVVGVDVQEDRVAQLAGGGAPVMEAGLSDAIGAGVRAGRIRATGDPAEALAAASISFLCVPTPPAPDGSLDTSAVEAVCTQIGDWLAGRPAGEPAHVVVIRSTVMPGTTARCRAVLEARSGAPAGERFVLAINPEFLREGSAVADFASPPYTLVGVDEPGWAEPLRAVYASIEAPFVVAGVAEAEVIKTVSNAWHATKVAFANEVGRLSAAVGADPFGVMDLFVRDTRLNLGPSYLRPGFAYGGSCLPKDVEALGHLARAHHLALPIVQAVPRSNREHVERACRAIEASGAARVGFLGLSFKAGTDDLRGSPLLDLVQFCLGRGLSVRIYDPAVQVAALVGSNRRYALSRILNLEALLVTGAAALVAHAELVVVGHATAEFAEACRGLPADRRVLDLARALNASETAATYEGACW